MSGRVLVDVPWMLRVTNLIQRINHGVLVVRLERNVEVDSGTGGRVAMILPITWDVAPGVLNVHVIPGW